MTVSQYDLVVRSSRIFAGENWMAGAIGVRDGRVAALLDSTQAAEVEAAKVIDVGDKPVIPGLVDTHAHFRDPGYTYKEDIYSGTVAAAAGGVTTVFDMPNVDPPTTTGERLKAHLENAAGKTIIDIGHNASGVVPENIPELVEGGATAFKVWQMMDIGRDYPHPPGTSLQNDGVLFKVFEAIAKTDRPLFVHPHDHDLYELFVERARETMGTDFRSYAKALRMGDSIALNSAIAKLLEMQRVTGARLHILHVSSRHGIEMIRRAKAEGRAVTAEANPFAMFLTNDWDKVEEHGPFCLGFYVPEEDNPAMWEAILDGTIDVIGSDHGPHTKEEKEVGWEDMYTAPGGQPMIEHYLQLMLTKVNEGVMTLDRVIELCCSAPAKLVGYYPQKGTIQVGSDADLVVLDMDLEEVLKGENTHYKVKWASTEGEHAKGKPVMTILRGTVIMENGEVTAEPGSGRIMKPAR